MNVEENIREPYDGGGVVGEMRQCGLKVRQRYERP